MAVMLTENTVIGETAVSPEKYRAFFRKAIEGFSPEIHCGEFQYWLDCNNGKTLKEAIESYRFSEPPKEIEERLTEERSTGLDNFIKNTLGKPCDRCGELIVKKAYLGGAVYYCSKCQPFIKN